MDPCPVLVGREQELAALRGLLDAGGGVAIVSGEAGIGKSRLVREFAALASEQGRIVLWGRPEEVAQPGPYALIVDLLESIAEGRAGDVKRDARALVAELMRPAGGDDQRPAPTPRAVAAEIRGLVAQLGAPPLVVLEDLHWADEASHSVVLHLARAARDDGHVIVVTHRGETTGTALSLERLLDSFERDRVAIGLELGPLSGPDVMSMIEAIAPGGIGDVERERIALLGEGIPFFIEELSDAATDGGLPKSVELTVNARLGRLDKEGIEIVRLASLSVGAIDAAVLSNALHQEPETVSHHLVDAVHLGLLAEREGRLMFRHSLVRESAAASITSLERADQHRRLARTIEELYKDDLELHSSTLARHYEAAGDRATAARYLLMAGERALAFAATNEARSDFLRASTLSDGAALDARRGLGEVEFREGNEGLAADLFRSVADEQRGSGDKAGAARSLGRLAWVLRNKTESDEVDSALDEALALLAGEESSHIYAELLVQKGQMLSFLFGRFLEAKPILEQAIGFARAHNDQGLVAQASDGLAQVADWEGQIEAALRHGKDATDSALGSRSAEVIGRTHNNHAVKLASYGRTREAIAVLEEGRMHLSRAYGTAGVSALDVSHAWIAWLMGLPGEVAALTARGHAAWQRWRGYRRILEVWAGLEQGQFHEAETRLTSAWIDRGGTHARTQYLATAELADFEARQLLYAEGLLHLQSGDSEQAVKIATAVVHIDTKSASELFDAGQGRILLAHALVAVKANQSAKDAIEDLEDLLRPANRYPYLEAHLLELRGIVDAIEGRNSDALAFFSHAAQSFERCSNQSDQARCERRAAETLLSEDPASGRTEAIVRLRRALALSEDSGAVAERNRVDSILRSLGVRARAGRPRKTDKGVLSPREAEVAVLVAAGITNADIAKDLFLSHRTVEDHISNALKKLKLSGRAGLAAWAARQGLV